MVSTEDLLVFKAIAARPKDLEDATSLLLMHPGVDVVAVRSRVAELAALAEAPELVAGFDAIVEQTRSTRPPDPSLPTPVGAKTSGKPRKRRG